MAFQFTGIYDFTQRVNEYRRNDYCIVTFRFPNGLRRLEWVAFVVDRGLAVNRTSKLCSRHFVAGVDYVVGDARRRHLSHTAVPSLVSV